MLSASTAAQTAAQTAAPAFEVGLRTGFGVPLGNVSAGDEHSMQSTVNGQEPLWLDLGYRFDARWQVGIYGQYAFTSIKNHGGLACPPGTTCATTGHDVRFGVAGHVHLRPGGVVDPWLGVGVGYETLSLSASGDSPGVGDSDGSVSYRGFEFVGLEAGADYRVTPLFGFGPFLSVSSGQYQASTGSQVETLSGKTTHTDLSGSIAHKTLHEWATLGFRGVFDFGL